MPELPEVEVVRQFLDQKIKGLTISDVEILNPKSFIGDSEFVKGQKITNISRIGKQLSLVLENNLVLLFHLKMTGQIIFLGTILGHPTPKTDNTKLPNKSTRFVFTFSDKSKLFFNDQRKFGWVKLLSPDELVNFQSDLGFDIFSSKFTLSYFYQQLQSTSRPIKTVLLDQSKFAGIGNIYANDALFLSGINPKNPANKISHQKTNKLHKHLISIMRQSVLAGGSTAKDNGYVKPDGSKGSNQFHFRVYQRVGEPCLKCKTPIEYIKVGGRGTFYCPKCQKL